MINYNEFDIGTNVTQYYRFGVIMTNSYIIIFLKFNLYKRNNCALFLSDCFKTILLVSFYCY